MYICYDKNIKDKILHIINLATKTTFTAKLNEVKDEIPNITNLAATASLNAKINYGKGKVYKRNF